MGAIKKTFAILVIVAIVYFATVQLNLSPVDNAPKISGIDREFGLGTEKLAPVTIAELDRYELALKMLNPANENEKNIIELKIEIARMQKSMLVLAENYPKINFSDVDCSAQGPLGISDSSANEALLHAKKAITLQAKIRLVQGSEYLASPDVKRALEFFVGAVGQTAKNLDYMCGKGTL